MAGRAWTASATGLAIEELARQCASIAVIAAVQNGLVNYPLMAFGTEEQKKNTFPHCHRPESGSLFPHRAGLGVRLHGPADEGDTGR